jgi:glycosyltransferase involved in cell wall biosynthesis
MIVLAYFIVSFSLVQLLVALVNFLFRQGISGIVNVTNQKISVMIPARNEENNIGNLLNDLLKQDYKNIEIIVFDDNSSDNTGDIVKEIAKKSDCIRLIHSEVLPEGWLGKNYACHTLSKHAEGDYFLFLDADVRIGSNCISNSLGYMQKYHLGLLSVFPKQIMQTIGEYLTVPNMNYILLSLLPLVLVRKAKYASLSAANGQFMLFNAAIYRKYLPHHRFRLDRVEDIRMAKFLKSTGTKIACLLGDDSVKCRMYRGFNEAANGFSKNIISFFGNSYVIAVLFWLSTTLGFWMVALGISVQAMFAYFIIILATRMAVSISSSQNVLFNTLLHIPQQLVIGWFIIKAIINKLKNKYEWKGRVIS